METIQELNDRMDGMISSIRIEDIKEQKFIAHKYMMLSLHIQTERDKIDRANLTGAKKLSSKKIYNLYLSLKEIMNVKAMSAKPEDMYNILIESQRLIQAANKIT